MGIKEQILALLKKEYQDGATYQEMSTRHNVSTQHVHDLTVGKNKVGKMSLDTLMRMFPRARIDLEPSGETTVSDETAADSLPPQFEDVIDAVMTSELEPAAKVKLYEIIHKIDRKQSRRAARRADLPDDRDPTVTVAPHPPASDDNAEQTEIDIEKAIKGLEKEDEITRTTRGKKDAPDSLHDRLRCPTCEAIFYVPKLRLKNKFACPFCGQHITVKKK